jgi:hypothetical protein
MAPAYHGLAQALLKRGKRAQNGTPEKVGETMRIGHQGFEIELHHGRSDWLWVVFDDEGDQLRSGHAPDRAKAWSRARRTVAWLRSPLGLWVERLLPETSHIA